MPETPEAPPEIPRPPAPVIAPIAMDDPSLTIPPNTGDAFRDLPMAAPPAANEDEDRAPTFVAFDVAPRLLNPDAVQSALERLYPSVLRDAGLEGSVDVWLHIDREGRVQEARVHQSSGYDAFDRAALQVADRMRFSPAFTMDRPVAVWVSIPVRFRVP